MKQREITFRFWKPETKDFSYNCSPAYWIQYGYLAGQYTGVKDNLGNKIFEGDIVKREYLTPHHRHARTETAEIFFHRGSFFANREDEVALSSIEERDMEIVGNIHENPEMLEIQ